MATTDEEPQADPQEITTKNRHGSSEPATLAEVQETDTATENRHGSSEPAN